jgi:spermidine/putrescine transport system permease protein
MRKRKLSPYLLLAPGLLWLIVFFVIPLYYSGKLSLYGGDTLEQGYRFDWDWSNFSDSLSVYDTQFLRSLLYAGIATILCLLIGYPVAYAIAFKAGKYRNLLLFAVVAPFFTTYLIRTLAWETILSDESPVVSFLQTIGVVADDGKVLATAPAVIAGLTYNFLPFMILPLYASLERVDARLIEAANDLYASARTAFRKVTLPITAPGIVAGTLLTFIPAMGDYINAFFLGGPNNKMIGNSIQSLYITQRDYPTAAALSFMLLIGIMAIVLIYIRFAGSEALMGDEEKPA